MTEHSKPERSCPAEVLDWIAWYPETNLPDDIRGTIEAHAAQCAPCRDEIASISGASVGRIAETPDPEQVFGRVRERIAGSAGQVGHATATRPGAPPRRPRPVWVATRRAALAAGLVLLVAAGIGGAMIASFTLAPGAYQTVHAPEPAVSPNVVQLDVVFRPDAAFGRIHDLLNELGASVVSGPTRGGVMRLHLPANSDPKQAASRLRAEGDGIALFAEPVLH